MNFTLTILLLAFSLQLSAQQCDCLKNLNLLQTEIEHNQASYQDQVIDENRIEAYLAFKTEINTKAKSITIKRDCVGLISMYLNFFRDEHSFISYNEQFASDEYHVRISKVKKAQNNFEGIWYIQDGSFSINVVPVKTTLGEYIALMHKDNTLKWKKGQVKIEFFKDGDQLKCVYWRQNLIPKTYDVSITDSTMKIGRTLKFYRQKQVPSVYNSVNEFLFSSLSEETSYLRLPSFDLSYIQRIDSILANHRKEMTSKRNLIIDIRNNGGGGFGAFKSLLPFVMDSPFVESPYYGSVWVSEDNFKYYDQTKYDYAETKQDSLNELEYIKYLQEHSGKFTPDESTIDTIVLEENSPLNIAVIFNKYSASTAEGFILMTGNSKKVKTFGENSAGAVSYGDWRPFEIPELNIWIAITTKKAVFRNNEDFESIGIAPDVDLRNYLEKDWVGIVLKELEEK